MRIWAFHPFQLVYFPPLLLPHSFQANKYFATRMRVANSRSCLTTNCHRLSVSCNLINSELVQILMRVDESFGFARGNIQSTLKPLLFLFDQGMRVEKTSMQTLASQPLSSAEPYEFLVKLRNITWETNYVIVSQNALDLTPPSRTTKCPLLSLHYPYKSYIIQILRRRVLLNSHSR